MFIYVILILIYIIEIHNFAMNFVISYYLITLRAKKCGFN